MAVPFPPQRSTIDYRPSRILAAGGGSCLMLQLSFSGPKCPQLNCASLAEQKKSTRWMRWMLPPQKNERILKREHFERTLRLNQPSIFEGMCQFSGGRFFGLRSSADYPGRRRSPATVRNMAVRKSQFPPTHSQHIQIFGPNFPPKNGSSGLYLEPK